MWRFVVRVSQRGVSSDVPSSDSESAAWRRLRLAEEPSFWAEDFLMCARRALDALRVCVVVVDQVSKATTAAME
jgi:hypothetical protein